LSLFGSIRDRLLADTEFFSRVGNKVQPGRVSSGWNSQNALSTTATVAPYVVITDIGGQYLTRVMNNDGSYIDVYEQTCQVATFGNGYDEAYGINRLVKKIIDNQYYNVDGVAVWLQPKSHHEIVQPQRSEHSADIWQMVDRYIYWNPVQIADVGVTTQVNGVGSIVLPAVGSAGNGN